uniref:NADH dehydrogenase subunit 4 n=1 Tax=Orosius sp. TaxID=2974349 RepID=UPI00218233C3|nr:NADH dehydrogenase subunit 4 [Orosius sp.]UVI59885.1 NADH dehydrogenase subunit 4 [Orosius sp.]
MMKFIMFLLFMTPLCLSHFWILFQVSLLFLLEFTIWMMSLNFLSCISYGMGIDMLSYGLLCLSLLIGSLMVISMVNCNWMGIFLFINLCMIFCLSVIFTTMNFMYMYISFEFVLVPLLILILGWGYQPERLLSGMYLFFYTVLVSLPILILIIYMNNLGYSLFFDTLVMHSNFFLLHFILMLVFMVKFPMFLVHYWLPKAHVQAPVSGSMILAGLMLKIGGYGLIRVSYIFEGMFLNYSYLWYSISMLGSVYIGLVCLVQGDMKCLIAYSSISHMGMVIMGLLTMGLWGLNGSFLLMIGHGFCSSGLFYMSNIFYLKTKSRSFYINKGLMNYLPSSSLFWFLLCAFNMSCPPSLNFLSEVMILISMISFWESSMYFFILLSFLCACFSYYLYSSIFHGMSHNLYSFSSVTVIEYLCVLLHLFPLVFCPLLLSMF